MAGRMSTYAADAFLAWLGRNTPMPTAPTNLHVSLHTADPGGTGANEVTTAAGSGWVGYARVAVPTGTAGSGAGSGWTAPAANGATRQIDNAGVVTFPASGATSGAVTVTHIGIFDAATGGNFLLGVALTASQVIGANASGPTVAVGALDLQILAQV